jgi:hypothetical protein
MQRITGYDHQATQHTKLPKFTDKKNTRDLAADKAQKETTAITNGKQ